MQQIIDANELTVEGLLNNTGQAYKVPRHQRQFEWTNIQWSDLWEDINIGTINESHFLGSIVVIPEDRLSVEINYFEVNDGQQRLTTILILLSVIRDCAKNLSNDEFASHITEHYLTANFFEGGSKKIELKMTLGKLDNLEFSQVLEGKLSNDFKEGHRIYECYNYFKEQINNYNLEQLEVLEKRIVKKIIVVHINVANQFNAFRLFETLNDRGLALSAVDLIKNHILMRAASSIPTDDSTIDSIVEEWQSMYEKIREYEPVTFFHRFLLSEYSGKVSAKDLYQAIKQRAENENWTSDEISKFTNKLNNAATIYTELLSANVGNLRINRRLSEVRLFEAEPSYTLLLKITPYLKANQLDEDQYLKIIDLIEAFHIRWGITGQSTSRLNEIYNRICSKLNSVEMLKMSDFIEQEFLSWASPIKDSAFVSSFQEAFGKPGDTRTKFIIWKLGNPAGEISLNFDEVHTEHIMPQTLSDEWIKELEKSSGLDISEIKKTHERLINKIGNFALIKGEWNIRMSNALFSEKKKQYVNSEINSTHELSNRYGWSFQDILDRTEELANKAIHIWKFSTQIPEVDITKVSLQSKIGIYSISSDIDLFCVGPDANAKANIIDHNIVRVQSGSLSRLDVAESFKGHSFYRLREQLRREGVLLEQGPSLVFTKDFDFSSASASATVVLGRAANGPNEWKDVNGRTINQLQGNTINESEIIEDKLEIHKYYNKIEIEQIFNTDFGARIKGITLRRDVSGNPYIILFHVSSSIYKDLGTKDKFKYYGEGINGDQELTASNKALIDSISDKRTIYGFWQSDEKSDYEYIGRLLVNDYQYISLEGRKVYEFDISPC